MNLPLLIGVDFSSRPTRRKPITLARGQLRGAVLQLQGALHFDTLDGFGAWLQQPGPWVGGFDLPFGLPRELVEQLGWPGDWAACMDHYAGLSRPQIRDTFAAFCNARPVGGKFAHRACDRPAGSSPSMKWVNPPVAYMLHAGVPLLRAAGVWLPAHEPARPLRKATTPQCEAWRLPDEPARPLRKATTPQCEAWKLPDEPEHDNPARVALEAYPGLLARELIGARSYKSDERAKQTPERLIARKDIVEALEQGRTRLGLRLKLSAAQRDALADDASGDALDAVLCLVQAGWAVRQPGPDCKPGKPGTPGTPGWGLPATVDPLEGWITSA